MHPIDYRLKEYCYTMDYNFYHIKGQTVVPITRKEYKEKTGESDYIIDKLRNSIWPWQFTNYFFKKIWDRTRTRTYEYATIDWKLYNLDKYLNNNGFRTSFLDQGDHNPDAFISINKNDFQKLKPFLVNKLGTNNVIEVNFDKTSQQNSSSYDYDEKKYKKKIIMLTKNWERENRKFKATSIHFDKSMIPWLHKKLNINMPDYNMSRSGGRIINQRFGKNPDL